MSDSPRTPIWRAIATALRDDIAEGRYGAGDKLPTEAALADRFGVNRHTVRHAIAHLAEAGQLRSRRGAGTFVTAPPADYHMGNRIRFHDTIRALGRLPSKRMLQIEERSASEAEARALAVEPGAPVCSYRGVSMVDGQPVALFDSLFALERLPEITEVFTSGVTSVTEALSRCGVADYRRVSTRLTAVRATATDALHLGVQESDPLLRSVSVNAGPDGTPVEYGRTVFAGDRVTLTLEPDGDS